MGYINDLQGAKVLTAKNLTEKRWDGEHITVLTPPRLPHLSYCVSSSCTFPGDFYMFWSVPAEFSLMSPLCPLYHSATCPFLCTDPWPLICTVQSRVICPVSLSFRVFISALVSLRRAAISILSSWKDVPISALILVSITCLNVWSSFSKCLQTECLFVIHHFSFANGEGCYKFLRLLLLSLTQPSFHITLNVLMSNYSHLITLNAE